MIQLGSSYRFPFLSDLGPIYPLTLLLNFPLLMSFTIILVVVDSFLGLGPFFLNFRLNDVHYMIHRKLSR
jgi:hypothetical protein